jgi:hypothetical protein
MPPVVRRNKGVTHAMLEGLEKLPFNGREEALFSAFDSAAQSTFIAYGTCYPTVRENMRQISAGAGQEFSQAEITAALGKILTFHRKTLALAGLPKDAIAGEDFRSMYSLVMHLIPDPDPENSRGAIREAFDKLKLDAPLSKEDVTRDLHNILALGEDKAMGRKM